MRILNFFFKINNIKYSLFGILFFLSNLPIVFFYRNFCFLDLKRIGLGTICFLSARSLGMAFNQILDCRFDIKNHRTASRPIPLGEISIFYALIFSGIALLMFLLSGYFLGIHCSFYSLFCIGLILFYPLTKRFTFLCHFILGGIYCVAVGNVFSVLTGKFFSYESILMGIAIGLVIAANDIGYAIQDRDFDRQEGLFSIPACYSLSIVFRLITLVFCLSLMCLILLGIVLSLSYHYYVLLIIPGVAMFLQYRRLLRYFYLKIGDHDLVFKGNFSIAVSFVLTTTLFFLYQRVF